MQFEADNLCRPDSTVGSEGLKLNFRLNFYRSIRSTYVHYRYLQQQRLNVSSRNYLLSKIYLPSSQVQPAVGFLYDQLNRG